MPKRPVTKIRLKSVGNGREIELRVVKETKTEWHGRYWDGTRWWPPAPACYIFPKNSQWVKS
jgi:hypothetical protein